MMPPSSATGTAALQKLREQLAPVKISEDARRQVAYDKDEGYSR